MWAQHLSVNLGFFSNFLFIKMVYHRFSEWWIQKKMQILSARGKEGKGKENECSCFLFDILVANMPIQHDMPFTS